MMTRLRELASTIRSKNAGVDHVTFDVIFRDRGNFERVRDSGVLARAKVAALFAIPEARITHHTVFEPANAIKFTIRRLRPSGTPGETDVFGSQQYAPLFDVEVP
jgi:hypothetical protein